MLASGDMKITTFFLTLATLSLNALAFELPRGTYTADEISEAQNKASERSELVAYMITFTNKPIS